jgi:hypothetical protein
MSVPLYRRIYKTNRGDYFMGLTLNDKKFKSLSGLNFKYYDDGSTYEYFCWADAGTDGILMSFPKTETGY